MFSSRLFWRIFLAYVILTVIAYALFVGYLSDQLRSIVLNKMQERLHDSAIIMSNGASDRFKVGPSEALQKELQELNNLTETRYTLIDNNGVVIGDSEEDPSAMDNHINRNEIILASQNGTGKSIRKSDTLGYEMFYFAIQMKENSQPVGFVRVALSMKAVDQEVQSVQKLVWLTAILISFALLASTYLLIRKIITPIETLTHAAQDMAEGNFKQNVEVQGQDEIGKLADSFNMMSTELARRIQTHEQQERELEENSKLLETVLGSMIEGVVVVDSNKNILYTNNAAKKLLGISSNMQEQPPVEEAIRLPVIQETIESILAGAIQKSEEFDILRSQCKASMLATRLPGNPCPGVVLVFHDVTELRHLENMRSEFVSNVSHELKTPLTSIQAYTETLLEGAIHDQNNNLKFLKRIEEQSNRLHSLILDLLSLAKIESADNVFNLIPINVSQTVEDCIESHQAKVFSKNLNLYKKESDPETKVLADAEGFRTILDNLVENALNYTPDGGEVSIGWENAENNMCAISVTDTGVGIPAEHHSRIFERFYRVDKARSRELGGTGLGLSIVKHLSQVFDGKVVINSTPGKGTTFTVYLPLTKS